MCVCVFSYVRVSEAVKAQYSRKSVVGSGESVEYDVIGLDVYLLSEGKVHQSKVHISIRPSEEGVGMLSLHRKAKPCV